MKQAILSNQQFEETLLRLSLVMGVTGLSRSGIYFAVKDKKFPAPIKIGKRAVAWKSSDINNWIKEKCQPTEEV
jgi:prophage regulatory protein